jgi:hypothetical protein
MKHVVSILLKENRLKYSSVGTATSLTTELRFPLTYSTNQQTTKSVALVRERTIPTEQPPLVGEVSANVCGYRVSRGQHN